MPGRRDNPVERVIRLKSDREAERVYLISDTHFFHNVLRKYRPKNFEEIIWNNLNPLVLEKKIDLLIHLGDFAWQIERHERELVEWRTLKREIKEILLIVGNHDEEPDKRKYLRRFFHRIYDFGMEIQYAGYRFLLTHYPADDEGRSERDRAMRKKVRETMEKGGYDFLLHGHVHIGENKNGKCKCYEQFGIRCLNLNLEYTDFRLLNMKEVLERLKVKYENNKQS